MNSNGKITHPHFKEIFICTPLYLTSEACEKELGQSDKLSRDTIMSHHSPQAFPVNTVKGLLEIDEVDIQRHLPLLTLLNDVSHGEDMIYTTPSCPESRLLLIKTTSIFQST